MLRTRGTRVVAEAVIPDELLGCYGPGNVRKLAEVVAATVLCGELSLGLAIVAEDWVQAHDLFGRRP